jgi:DNA-3-methyladenine glycosylase
MHVTVRLGEPLNRAVGALRVSLEFAAAPSVADVLRRLAAEHPGFEAAYRGEGLGFAYPYRVYVNAREVKGDEAAQAWRLANGDRLYIFLPVAGGQDAAPLPRQFYARPTLEVARDLLGRRLVRTVDGRRLAGRIFEVEAYIGETDRASHAARGRTARNRTMYGLPGCAYVYFIYGMYYCLNVVTESEGFPAAVLVRAIQPEEGVDVMLANRARPTPARALADGPGKLCQALAIDRRLDGHDLTMGQELWIEAGQPLADEAVTTTARINVRGDEQALAAPWRFVAQPRLSGEAG